MPEAVIFLLSDQSALASEVFDRSEGQESKRAVICSLTTLRPRSLCRSHDNSKRSGVLSLSLCRLSSSIGKQHREAISHTTAFAPRYERRYPALSRMNEVTFVKAPRCARRRSSGPSRAARTSHVRDCNLNKKICLLCCYNNDINSLTVVDTVSITLTPASPRCTPLSSNDS